MRFVLYLALAFAISSAHAITATKAYVDSATNATLVAAKEYTDTHGGGGVTQTTVTNIAEYVTSNIVTKSYVEGLGIEAGINSTTATNISGYVTSNVVTKSYVESLGITETDPTATAKAQAAIAAAGCVRTNEFGFAEVGSIAVESSIDVGTYVSISSMALHYDYIESTWGNLLFPWSDSYDEDLYHAIATRSQIPTSSDYIATKGGTNSVDQILAAARTDSGSIATNVVSEVMEYGLTNLVDNTETFALESGIIGNLELDGSHTNINLTLVYPTENDRAADIILRVNCTSNTTLAVSMENTDVDGTEWTSVKQGLNYITATRTAYKDGKSKVLVNVKEVK